MQDYETLECDVLVIGSGASGIRAAFEAASYGVKVSLLNKGVIGWSGATITVAPSYEAAIGHEDLRDNPKIHFEDIVKYGRFLGDENLIKVLTNEATERLLDLELLGVQFEMENSKFRQVWEPGQKYPRTLRIKGGGRQLMKKLCEVLFGHIEIDLYEDHIAISLLTDGKASARALKHTSITVEPIDKKRIIRDFVKY